MDGQTAVDTAVFNKFAASEDLDGIEMHKNQSPPILQTAFPYILVEYMRGGLLNDSPHDVIDTSLLITAVSKNLTQAKEVAAYIEEALKNQVLTYPDGWVSWMTVRQTDFFSKSINIQNDQYHKVGAIYRFRATKSKG